MREGNREQSKEEAKQSIYRAVSQKLADVGVDDVVNVEFIEETLLESVEGKRDEGIVAFRTDSIFATGSNGDSTGLKQTDLNEQKAAALTQLLYGWGLLDDLSYEDQARLVRDILEVVLVESLQ